jgi:hypothetical protein
LKSATNFIELDTSSQTFDKSFKDLCSAVEPTVLNIISHGEGEDVSDLDIPAWWKSSGLIHHDSDLIDTDNVLSIHQNNVWHELDLGWPNGAEDSAGNVVFADFKKIDEPK